MSDNIKPPNCLSAIKADPKYKDVYEGLFLGFFKNNNNSIEEIQDICKDNNTLLENIELTETKLKNAQYVNCEIIKKNFPAAMFCWDCTYAFTKKIDSTIPANVKEEILLNLAQQNKYILESINPDKLTALGQNENKDTYIYKEFYNFLNNENSIENEVLLKTLKRIHENNSKNPASLQEIKLKKLTDYMKDESIKQVTETIDKKIKEERAAALMNYKKLFNKEGAKVILKDKNNAIEETETSSITSEEITYKEPITLLSVKDISASVLFESFYVAIEVKGTELYAYGDKDTNQLFIIPKNDETLKIIERITTKNKPRIIAKDIYIHNEFLKLYNLQINKLIPLDIVCNSIHTDISNLELKDYIEKYKTISKGSPFKSLLSYVTLTTKTKNEIQIARSGPGFYRLLSTEEFINEIILENKCVFEVDIESFIKKIENRKVTYKDVYYNIASAIDGYNERKVPIEVIATGEKFIISCSNNAKTIRRIRLLIIITLKQIVEKLSENDNAYISIYKR